MSVTPRSPEELAAAREQAAADLEGAIDLLGIAYKRYNALTRDLSAAIGKDLTYSLDAPIAMHFGEAGLSAFLERKLVGKPGSLRNLVADAHQRMLNKGRT